MKHQQDYQMDIRLNKIKQGFLIKRSRILKQWKQRWMVLTKTHLYSFIHKQQYKKPTQAIQLKQVSTIKSYYKNQYNRPQVIRIQSQDADFYLSAKNHQQKWAWMTAVQKVTDLLVCGQEQGESQNMIRETIRMTTAIRKTVNMKVEKILDVPKDLMKRLRLGVESNCSVAVVVPTLPFVKQIPKQQQISLIDKVNSQSKNAIQNNNQQKGQTSTKNQENSTTSTTQPQTKIIQKIIYVPEIKEKIIYVPEIKQVIKEVIKTVYVNRNKNEKDNLNNNTNHVDDHLLDNSQLPTILHFLQQVMQLKCQNPKPLIEFIVFLIFSQPQKYTQLILQFAVSPRIQHAFSNAFLQVINQCNSLLTIEIDQTKLNSYLQFIMVLYQNNNEYFYQNDLKLLIEILVRQMEMNRSCKFFVYVEDLNQFLVIGVLNAMAGKQWWGDVKHRREELISVVRDVMAWTTDPQMKFAAQEFLEKV